MTILDRIIVNKIKEVSAKKAVFPVPLLEKSFYFNHPTNSMAQALKNSNTGIIAEHKRRSPSKSVINERSLLTDIVSGYQNAGVSAVSVLTDTFYFGGSLDDLLLAKKTISIPVLRKEFIIDPYQIIEAKAYGADAILLIASALTSSQLKSFSELAKLLKLDVLLEVHDLQELKRSLLPTVDMLGVNNRNLKTFEVTTNISKHLSEEIPEDFVKVSESGISSIEAVKELRTFGFQGFLMGEHFMRTEDPGRAAANFIERLNR